MIDSPFAKIRGKGFFVKKIEKALLRKEIDLAVHSLKDLPVDLPSGVTIGAVTKREEAWDILMLRGPDSKVRCIGTGSLRRKNQLLAWKPNWKVVDLRGNLDTRIRKLQEGKFDAMVVAAAGLRRLGIRNSKLRVKKIPFSRMLPAPGQGALAIECRKDDEDILTVVRGLNHRATELAVCAERTFLEALGGGCQTPLGAYAKIKGSRMKLQGMITPGSRRESIKAAVSGLKNKPEELGRRLAEKLIRRCPRYLDLLRWPIY